MEKLLAVIIFFLTLALVITKPKGIGIGWSAWAGALACLLFGLVSLSDVLYITKLVWDATLAFIFLIFISIILDKAGFFEWASLVAIKSARGNGFLLFLYIMLLGAFISAIFANDGTALMLTPIVYSKVKYLRLPERSVLPYIMGSGFIADTASLPLVISNLTNIITAHFFQMDFVSFALYMIFPNFVAVLVSILALYLFYRKDMIKRYDPEVFETLNPRYAVKDPIVFWTGWGVMVFLGLSFFLLSFLGWSVPFSLVLGLSALALLVSALKNKVINIRDAYRSTPWDIVFFSVGMYTVVYSLKKAGLTSLITSGIQNLYAHGELYAILGTGFVSAFMSAVMNNLPTVMMMNLAIMDGAFPEQLKQFLALANLVGTNIGPKITPIGSLATLLWLYVLERKGIKIGWSYYMKVGLILTPPVILFTLLAVYLSFLIFT
ncbi:MAG: arsenic transporter [Hydrogenobacter sp.]